MDGWCLGAPRCTALVVCGTLPSGQVRPTYLSRTCVPRSSADSRYRLVLLDTDHSLRTIDLSPIGSHRYVRRLPQGGVADLLDVPRRCPLHPCSSLGHRVRGLYDPVMLGLTQCVLGPAV